MAAWGWRTVCGWVEGMKPDSQITLGLWLQSEKELDLVLWAVGAIEGSRELQL